MIYEHEQRFDKMWSPAAQRNWVNLTEVLWNGLMLKHLFNGPIELTIPRAARETRAESMIRAFANVCKYRSICEGDGYTWALDRSMKPASATREEEKVVFGAATGPSTLF